MISNEVIKFEIKSLKFSRQQVVFLRLLLLTVHLEEVHCATLPLQSARVLQVAVATSLL